jgi:D-3-phosphoglycerate dehydrogenase
MDVSTLSSRQPVVVLTDSVHDDAMRLLEGTAQVRVLPRSLPRAEQEAALRELLADGDALIVRRRLPADAFDAAPRLRAVVRHGAGVDIIPVDRATALGIPVANVPGGNAQAVAEYAIAAMMDLARGLREADREIRAGTWRLRGTPTAIELRGRTLGIVGFGAIGSGIATIAHHGFGMSVLAHTPRPGKLPAHVRAAGFEELLGACDIVAITCPLTPQTRGLFDARAFGQMKPGALLVNVSRGAVVKEADLAQALREHRLGGAALDVFELEPLPQDSLLRELPRLLMTPHFAGQTVESERALGLAAAEATLALLRGDVHPHIVNPGYADHAHARAAGGVRR